MSDVSAEVRNALTMRAAWDKASGAVRMAAMNHVDDAVRQIMAQSDRDKRRAMTGRLPKHIAEIVVDRVKAMWPPRPGDVVWVVFATDASPEGVAEATEQARDRRGKLHVQIGRAHV